MIATPESLRNSGCWRVQGDLAVSRAFGDSLCQFGGSRGGALSGVPNILFFVPAATVRPGVQQVDYKRPLKRLASVAGV